MGLGDCFLHNQPWYDKEIVFTGEIPSTDSLQVEQSIHEPTLSGGEEPVDRRSVRCSLYHLSKYVDDEVCFPNSMPDHWDLAEKEDGKVTAMFQQGRQAKLRKTIGAMELPIDEVALLQKPSETFHARQSASLPPKNGKTYGKVVKRSFHRMQMSDVYDICLPSTWIEWE